MCRACLVALALSVSGAAVPARAQTGDLDPPPGPVEETMKPLDVVEARTPIGPDTTPGDADNIYIISEPGSYYLTGNIFGQPAMNGIRITANNVTLDLNGFTISGQPNDTVLMPPLVRDAQHTRSPARGSTDELGLTGIVLLDFRNAVTIRNGTVRDWERDGIAFSSDSGLVENVSLISNRRWGIDNANAFGTRFVNCRSSFNGDLFNEDRSTGALRAGVSALVSGWVSYNDSRTFVVDNSNATILDSACHAPSFECVLITAEGCAVRRSTFSDVTASGIAAIEVIEGHAVVIERCVFEGNTRAIAMTMTNNPRVEGCSIVGADIGIETVLGERAVITHNTIDATDIAVLPNSDSSLVEHNAITSENDGINVLDNFNVAVLRNTINAGDDAITGSTGNRIAPIVSPETLNASPLANVSY